MKSDIWRLLGIEPTSDKKAIRSAYAAQSRLHHPEEEPEYFARLNQAYRQALRFVRTGGAGGSGETIEEDAQGSRENGREYSQGSKDDSREHNGNDSRDHQKGRESWKTWQGEVSGRTKGGAGDGEEEKESALTETEEKKDSLLERLAVAQQQAIRESMLTGALHDFIDLFENPRQAKQADAWRRFFLSESFLGEQFSEEFARGLYTYLMEQEICPGDNLPVALLQELAIAYALIPHFAGEEYGEGMKYPKEWYKVSVEQTFPARKQVAEIFNRQGWDCDLKSITRRMLKQPANKVRHNAFSDYLSLKEMGHEGQLTEAEKETWQHILGLAQVYYLYERNGKRLGGADYESRSECVVKLYVQWLKDERLPECVLKFLYQKFSFRELDRSSTRGLYGALKEQVLGQLPQVEELLFGQDGLEQKITKVYRICSRIINDNQNNYEKSIYEETPQIQEQVKALFAMPEWKEVQGEVGLFDRLYSGAKRLVMPCSLAEGLIRCLQQGDFPEPKRTELLESLLRSLATGQMCREIDYRFHVSFPTVDMDRLGENADFWQYYLMRGYGFRHSPIRGDWEDGYLYTMDGECYLPGYIRYIYAPSREWQKAFTGFSEQTESNAAPVSVVCALPDQRALRVEFHYHYCLYFVEEEPVLSPVLSFAQLCQWAEEHSRTGLSVPQDFFFLLAVTAIEASERKEAEALIYRWLGELPLHSHICPLVARLLAADNDRLPVGTEAVYYEEQERFCFRAVVSGEGVRIFRQAETGWEDRIFRRTEFGWKEISLPVEALHLLRQPKPVLLSAQNLAGMDLLEKARAILKVMGFPGQAEGYCVLCYGEERCRRHDKVFYGALSPFGFPIGAHSTEHERTLHFHMDVSRTKIKEGKRYIGRFGWGFKYSHLSDYGPICVYQGDSGIYYADGAIKMYRAASLEELLADCLGQELEGVTQVESYKGLLTISRLDHRLEYCYGEEDFQESVHGTGRTVADFFTIFGGYRLWVEFAWWMDAALEKGLPDWVNVLTIGRVLGKESGEGSVLSLTANHVEEVNLDLMERQESLQPEDFQEEYALEAPCFVWGKGLTVQSGRQTLRDVVKWYLEEWSGAGAKLLQNHSIRVDIVDQMAIDN